MSFGLDNPLTAYKEFAFRSAAKVALPQSDVSFSSSKPKFFSSRNRGPDSFVSSTETANALNNQYQEQQLEAEMQDERLEEAEMSEQERALMLSEEAAELDFIHDSIRNDTSTTGKDELTRSSGFFSGGNSSGENLDEGNERRRQYLAKVGLRKKLSEELTGVNAYNLEQAENIFKHIDSSIRAYNVSINNYKYAAEELSGWDIDALIEEQETVTKLKPPNRIASIDVDSNGEPEPQYVRQEFKCVRHPDMWKADPTKPAFAAYGHLWESTNYHVQANLLKYQNRTCYAKA